MGNLITPLFSLTYRLITLGQGLQECVGSDKNTEGPGARLTWSNFMLGAMNGLWQYVQVSGRYETQAPSPTHLWRLLQPHE